MKVVADELKESLKNVCFVDSRWFSSKCNLFADLGFVDVRCRYEQYEYRVMSFELANASATFLLVRIISDAATSYVASLTTWPTTDEHTI
jgi:hypothetical protein